MSDTDRAELNILVVDDHSLTRDMVGSILKNLGFPNLVLADNGITALRKMEDKSFDLVICDWKMPRLTGLALLKEVRSRKEYAGVPFLMLTAEVYKENVVEAVNAGASDYISKPFTADVLERKINQLLDLKKQEVVTDIELF